MICCIYIEGSPKVFGLHEMTTQLLERVSSGIPNTTVSDLFKCHFHDLALFLKKSLTIDDRQDQKKWVVESPELHAFDALVRLAGGRAVSLNFNVVTQVLELHLGNNCDDESDYEVKIFLMGLVETIVSDNESSKELLVTFMQNLVESCIIPNLVWRAGGMASALRKVAAASLFTILKHSVVTDIFLKEMVLTLFPILKTNLSDCDESIRELMILSFGIIFGHLPGMLEEDSIQLLYSDLIKCLDDSSQCVRLAGCHALKQFLKAGSPIDFGRTPIDYIVENLFIQMDDPDPKYQGAVLDVLIVALEIDSDVVFKYLKISELEHRSTHFTSILKKNYFKDKTENVKTSHV
eukprot:CAMPEP_0184868668 /NCGR_PEP_ID=MMETSP0580-20130426/31318_1 /TAXON_ID=1118495 /ORGANISM="Dactyliosolen fragilissimus" /LENGTH=349 /DNA_ID=CAMNT_0027369711 /DNA_START=89 /DNA_END=1138 /DNA_ORIENTATION=-